MAELGVDFTLDRRVVEGLESVPAGLAGLLPDDAVRLDTPASGIVREEAGAERQPVAYYESTWATRATTSAA